MEEKKTLASESKAERNPLVSVLRIFKEFGFDSILVFLKKIYKLGPGHNFSFE
jgi:hypothetical protein